MIAGIGWSAWRWRRQLPQSRTSGADRRHRSCSPTSASISPRALGRACDRRRASPARDRADAGRRRAAAARLLGTQHPVAQRRPFRQRRVRPAAGLEARSGSRSRSASTIRSLRLPQRTQRHVRAFLVWSRMPIVVHIDGRAYLTDQRFYGPLRSTFGPWRDPSARSASTFLIPLDKPATEFITRRGMSTRGEHLVRADRGFATGGGLVARLTAPAFSKVLDQIDRRLACGGIEATLPGGEQAPAWLPCEGPKAVVRLSSWLALVRLATSGSVGWYKAWTLGEWSSPDPVKVFELFSANAVRARRCRPRQGAVPLDQRACPSSARQRAGQGAAEHRRALRPRQRLLFGVARCDDDLFSSARFRVGR